MDHIAAAADPRLEQSKNDQVERRESASADVTYEVIRREGEHELGRATSALAWSGFAAGLSMGLSFLTQGLLHHALPAASWSPLVVKLGYAVGFLVVILGAQQLFTENTLKPVVPALVRPSRGLFGNIARVWVVVLLANLLGTLCFAMLMAWTRVLGPEQSEAMLAVARESLRPDIAATFVKAIVAGWLIALMVWLLPGAEYSKAFIIILLAWLVGIAGLSHIIAGASESLYLVVLGEASVGTWLSQFFLPTLLGNVIGGTFLVAALNHAQVAAGKRERAAMA